MTFRLLCIALGLGFLACSELSSQKGSVRILLEPEDTITNGLEPGDNVENIADGWRVTYHQYLITIGDIGVQFARNSNLHREARDVFAVDLMQLSESGEPLWELSELDPGRWEFGYKIGSTARLLKHKSVAAEDFDTLRERALTYLIKGSLTKEGGVSCPPRARSQVGDAARVSTNAGGDPCYSNPEIGFTFQVQAATQFGPCQIDGVPGFSVPEGGTSTVAATIHGDHLFFNGFPAGTEGGIIRLAQLWADTDLNLDGQLTEQELTHITPADLSEFDERYQTGAAPVELRHMWDYLVGQLMTQGHMDGEGECPFENLQAEQDPVGEPQDGRETRGLDAGRDASRVDAGEDAAD